MLTARATTACSVSAVGPGPYCLLWPPPLHVCLQLTFVTTQAPVAGPYSQVCVHHWLQLPPLSTLVPTCWTQRCHPRAPTALAASVDPLQCSPRTTQLLMLWTPSFWASESPFLPWTLRCHTPLHFAPCTTRPKITAHSSVPPSSDGGFPLPKSAHKVWKRWLLLQMCRHLHQAMGIMKNQGKKYDFTKWTQ